MQKTNYAIYTAEAMDYITKGFQEDMDKNLPLRTLANLLGHFKGVTFDIWRSSNSS